MWTTWETSHGNGSLKVLQLKNKFDMSVMLLTFHVPMGPYGQSTPWDCMYVRMACLKSSFVANMMDLRCCCCFLCGGCLFVCLCKVSVSLSVYCFVLSAEKPKAAKNVFVFTTFFVYLQK